MYKISADAEKNRLYITVGESNGARMASLIDDADLACGQLESDFTCLIHFKRGTLLRQQDEGVIFRLQNILHSRGVSKTIYVRPEGSVLGRFQLEMLQIHSECPGQTVCSLDEGEALLSNG